MSSPSLEIVEDPEPWTKRRLEEIVAAGLLHAIADNAEPEWLVPSSDAEEPHPLPGYVVSFMVYHERGLGVLANRFMRALPHYYGVELHNFTPNSIAQAAIFVTVREGYLGIAPHRKLWVHLFKAEPYFKVEDEGARGVSVGGCVVQVLQGREGLYIPAKLSSFTKGWQEGWFYLRNDGGQFPEYTGCTVTARPECWVRGVGAKKARLKPLLDALGEMRKQGLTAAGVVGAFHRSQVLPLAERRLRLNEMRPGAPVTPNSSPRTWIVG